MEKVAIVTDSIACLTREMVGQYQIKIVPINIHFGDKVYRDWVDITPDEAYEMFLEDHERFNTSAASPMDCLETYREVSQQAKNILFVTVSAKISTMYNVALVAREQAKEELPQTSIEVLDSRTATAAEGFIALAAAQAAEEGKSLGEVVKAAEEVRERVGVLVFLNTVRYVYRSGRIPKVAARAGSILSIRPIFSVSGEVHFVGVVRNRGRGIDRMLKIMKDKVGQSPAHIAVMHAYDLDEAKRLGERVSSEFNCKELWVTEFSPVMGYSCGTGTLGVAFYKED